MGGTKKYRCMRCREWHEVADYRQRDPLPHGLDVWCRGCVADLKDSPENRKKYRAAYQRAYNRGTSEGDITIERLRSRYWRGWLDQRVGELDATESAEAIIDSLYHADDGSLRCEGCGSVEGDPTVRRILPIDMYPELMYSRWNLRSLCRNCFAEPTMLIMESVDYREIDDAVKVLSLVVDELKGGGRGER